MAKVAKVVFLKTDREYREEEFVGKDGQTHIKTIPVGGGEVFAFFPEMCVNTRTRNFRCFSVEHGDSMCALTYAVECEAATRAEYRCLELNITYMRGLDLEVLDADEWKRQNAGVLAEMAAIMNETAA